MNILPKKPDSKPVKFAQANFVYQKPDGMTDEQCGPLPCYRDQSHTISCWKFCLRDRLNILFRGHVWLYMLMPAHPPTCLMAESPFPKQDKKKIDNRVWLAIATVAISALIVLFALKVKITIG